MLIIDCTTVIHHIGIICGGLIFLYAFVMLIRCVIRGILLDEDGFELPDENKETKKELCATEKNNKCVLYSEDIDGERITVYEQELEPDYDLEKQITNLQKENKQ